MNVILFDENDNEIARLRHVRFPNRMLATVWQPKLGAVRFEEFHDAYDTAEEMKKIRKRRDLLLSRSDHKMLPDFPIDETYKQSWANYRQQLRELPQNIDLAAPVWPANPDGQS